MIRGHKLTMIAEIAFATSVLAALIAGCGGGGSAGPTLSPIQAGTRSADYGTYWSIPEPVADSTQKFSWVCPFPNDGELDQVKQIQPGGMTKIATPFNAFLIRPTVPWICGVPYDVARQKGWILSETYVGSNLVCDIGAPGFADAWADNAIARAKQFNSQYIFMDSVDVSLRYYDVPRSKYLTDAEWESAMRQFIKTVSGRVHAAGFKVGLNVAQGGHLSFLTAPGGNYIPMCELLMNERFAFWPDSNNRKGCHIEPQIIDLQINDVQTIKKQFVLIAELMLDDPQLTQKVDYALAEYLICRKPGDVFILTKSPDKTFWHPEMANAQQLGSVQGKPSKVGGLWIRRYQRGTVLLNATDNPIQVPAEAGPDSASLGTVPPRTGVIPKANP